MDNRRFDSLAKSFATGASRRSVLKGILGLGGVALAGVTLRPDSAQAARRPAPTPKPLTCPGVQKPVGGVCTCDSPLQNCGPDCCNPTAAAGTSAHSECCNNACCVGHCYGEELCCAYPNVYCEGLGCLAPGSCCTVDDCPGEDGLCQSRTCIEGVCDMSYLEAGTLLPDQVAGDCLAEVCDGNGRVFTIPFNADTPPPPSECLLYRCIAGEPELFAREIGTPCTGGACNQFGDCIPNVPS